MVGTLKRAELCHRTELGRNRWKCSRNMATFRFFKMRSPPSWFLKFQIFKGRAHRQGWTASLCQISPKSVKPGRRYGEFFDFSTWRWAPSWIFKFMNS